MSIISGKTIISGSTFQTIAPSAPSYVVQSNLNGLNISGQGYNILATVPTVGNLLVAIGTEYPGIRNIKTGWTQIYNTGEGFDDILAAYRIVQPGDTTTCDWLYSGGGSYAGIVGVWEIKNYDANATSFVDLTFANQSSVSGNYNPTIGSTTTPNQIVLSLTESTGSAMTPDPQWIVDQYTVPVLNDADNHSTGRGGLMTHQLVSTAGPITQSIGFASSQTGEMGIVSIKLV